MEVLHPRCCGLDVHKETVVACVRLAIEATGVYWKPVWHILADGGFELVLANAAHIKNVPGRKTDVKDADWISEFIGLCAGRPDAGDAHFPQDAQAIRA